MWKVVNGKLIQTVDETRTEYKTRISASLIKKLKIMAEQSNSHISYLLENGFKNILSESAITYDKKNRPKDRVEFRTTCDKDTLASLRLLAKNNKLNLNDVIEASIPYIDQNNVKHANWRYRIEKE
ncbi:rRNA methyltransferase [Psychrobacillus sp. INOP01]|uniref:rRNA methyltransferase n=1 Tax=Psychrobacillus sp. INOP01 TaxID=2829187 RepID=UPI001BA9459A|nr:rRNA methyltransferase [Psychrobacillus sp. INOP01]QUG41775.1 rRNA methyltransferase [Psychrobacillus sp. INOP01]